jgi:hypothetical protein
MVGIVVHVPVGDPEYPAFGKIPVSFEFAIDSAPVPDTNHGKVSIDKRPVDLPVELAHVNPANWKISEFYAHNFSRKVNSKYSV